MSRTIDPHPLFTASGSPTLPETMSPKKFEELLKRWGGDEVDQIQNYLKTLNQEEQLQAVLFMQHMDQRVSENPEEISGI